MVKERRNSLSTRVNLGLAGFITQAPIGGKSTFGLGVISATALSQYSFSRLSLLDIYLKWFSYASGRICYVRPFISLGPFLNNP
jgi:hypothetical protein